MFSVFWEGIPVIYYGDEQYFNGGGDPYCREALWENGYNKESRLFQLYKIGLHYRKKIELWDKTLDQFYSDKEVYAFRRGEDVLVVISLAENDNYNKSFDNKGVTNNQGIKAGKYCNIFVKDDCIEIVDGQQITISIGKAPKVYIPESEIDEFTK